MRCTVLLIPLILLAACAAPSRGPIAAKSACPDTLPDVDRLACWASASPDPVTANRPAPVLLRGPDGTAIIGPKQSE